MAKKILSVGFVFPGNMIEFVPLDSNRSLLDADLVIFRPSVEPFVGVQVFGSTYQGKPSLSEDLSFRLQDAAAHWRRQIQLVLEAGKNVILILTDPHEVFVDTGRREYSGTGRNQRTTRIVQSFNNYLLFPRFYEEMVAAAGAQMVLTEQGQFLGQYWKDFGAASTYRVAFKASKVTPLITTRGANLVVACRFVLAGVKGHVLALPPIQAYDVEPSHYSDRKWSKEDKRIGQQLSSAFLTLDGLLRPSGGKTPVPDWAKADEFLLLRERELMQSILVVDQHIAQALEKRANLSKELANEAELRGLLYESGGPLENAILIALRILGFTAQRLKSGQSEFDAVFVSPEGRFLGEAEGKENKQVNIDKLRQLEMNIQEDFEREDVTEHARGVLFGNAYRMQQPPERPDAYFSEKCLAAAARSKTALIRTTDLFVAAKVVKDSGDLGYAAACRKAILEQGGKVVVFPARLEDDTNA